MKYLIILFLMSLSIPVELDGNISRILVGQWRFTHLLDNENNVVKKIKNNRFGGVEIVNRPSLNFHKDGTYESKYPFGKWASGKWEYLENENLLIFYLHIDSSNAVGKDLIKKKIAQKHTDGRYYQYMEKQVISITENELILFEKPNRKLIYHKK